MCRLFSLVWQGCFLSMEPGAAAVVVVVGQLWRAVIKSLWSGLNASQSNLTSLAAWPLVRRPLYGWSPRRRVWSVGRSSLRRPFDRSLASPWCHRAGLYVANDIRRRRLARAVYPCRCPIIGSPSQKSFLPADNLPVKIFTCKLSSKETF